MTDKVREVAPTPTAERTEKTPLCKEGEHDFGKCTTCGMPWLASRLEDPTSFDIAWAVRVIHSRDKHGGAFELCAWPSCAGQVLDEELAKNGRQGVEGATPTALQARKEKEQEDHTRVDGVPSDRPMGSTASSREE